MDTYELLFLGCPTFFCYEVTVITVGRINTPNNKWDDYLSALIVLSLYSKSVYDLVISKVGRTDRQDKKEIDLKDRILVRYLDY
jgi:hypothetical protein